MVNPLHSNLFATRLPYLSSSCHPVSLQHSCLEWVHRAQRNGCFSNGLLLSICSSEYFTFYFALPYFQLNDISLPVGPRLEPLFVMSTYKGLGGVSIQLFPLSFSPAIFIMSYIACRYHSGSGSLLQCICSSLLKVNTVPGSTILFVLLLLG